MIEYGDQASAWTIQFQMNNGCKERGNSQLRPQLRRVTIGFPTYDIIAKSRLRSHELPVGALHFATASFFADLIDAGMAMTTATVGGKLVATARDGVSQGLLRHLRYDFEFNWHAERKAGHAQDHSSGHPVGTKDVAK